MPETKLDIVEDIFKFFNKIYHSKWKWFAVPFLLLVIVIWCKSSEISEFYKSRKELMKKVDSPKEENHENQPKLEKTKGETIEKCDFTDLGNWLGVENFEIEKDNIFKPVLSENFPSGREMFCDQSIGMNFSLPIKFTPLNEDKINLSINYGYLWRIIIGNDDYKQIRLQINEKYLSEDREKAEWKDVKGGIFWINRPKGLTPLKQIKATIVSKLSDVKNKKVNVSIYISGVSNYDETDYESTPPFSVDLSLPKDKKDFSENVGIGILDTKKEGVKIQLEEFKLQELGSLD